MSITNVLLNFKLLHLSELVQVRHINVFQTAQNKICHYRCILMVSQLSSLDSHDISTPRWLLINYRWSDLGMQEQCLDHY